MGSKKVGKEKEKTFSHGSMMRIFICDDSFPRLRLRMEQQPQQQRNKSRPSWYAKFRKLSINEVIERENATRHPSVYVTALDK